MANACPGQKAGSSGSGGSAAYQRNVRGKQMPLSGLPHGDIENLAGVAFAKEIVVGFDVCHCYQ